MEDSADRLALFDWSAVRGNGPLSKYGRRKRGGYVPKFEVTDQIRNTNELLDQLLANRAGLTKYEGRCVGCGRGQLTPFDGHGVFGVQTLISIFLFSYSVGIWCASRAWWRSRL
jgi:hypothetical protein